MNRHCPSILAASLALLSLCAACARANPPAGKYIFPAGGQRGTTVCAKVGGCYFHGEAGFEMLGNGIQFPDRIRETDTIWFEGPLIPQPASQQAEDYPRDHACELKIAADAELGSRGWRAWTSQGATSIGLTPGNDPRTALPGMRFIVGDLPEVVEQEVEGTPAPVKVNLPVTINGRIFPRENVDAWAFMANAGQQITCDAWAKRLGSPLDAELQILDPAGRPVHARVLHVEGDPCLHFTAASDGLYQVRIHDVAYGGLQNYVYRLTVTADPWIDSIYPLGGRRGSTVRLELSGHGLGAKTVDAQLPVDASAGSRNSGAANPAMMQFELASKRSNPVRVSVDDLPEVLESEPNDVPGDAPHVAVPAILNGRIDHPGDVDYWAVEAKKDQLLQLDLLANRLGSPLDSVLSIEDALGKQLARNDDAGPGLTDSQLAFKVPADGVYYIRVEDRFASRGGSAFAYRLRVTKAEPDFQLTLASDVIILPRVMEHPEADTPDKKSPPALAMVKVDLQRFGGFDGPVKLTFDGLPQGVTVDGATIPARQASANVKLIATPHTKIGAVHLRIHGTGDIAGKPVDRAAALPAALGLPPVDDVLLAVAMQTPFKVIGHFEMPFIACGSVFRRHYQLDRGGFDGPITIRLADRQMRHLQGVRGPEITVPAGADAFDYAVTFASEMELGRTSRSCIMASGVMTDFDGSKHVVSFCSVDAAEQFAAVTTASLLSLRTEKTSVLAQPLGTEDLPIHIQRADRLSGQPITVDLVLPPGLRDVRGDPLTLAGDQSDAVLHLHFGAKPGPITLPVILRATAPGPQDPSRVEVKVELVETPK